MRELLHRIALHYPPDIWIAVHQANIDPQSFFAGVLTFLIWAHCVSITAKAQRSTITKRPNR